MIVEVIKEDLYTTIDGNQTGADEGKNSVQKRTRTLYDFDSLIRI